MADFAGKDGFIWWVGFVEDRKDPLKLGRLKVRCVAWDSQNKMEVPTSYLPWAQVVTPLNKTPKEGDMVLGFFADGVDAQQRIVFGYFPGIPLNPANPQEAFSDPRTATELKTAPKTPKEKIYNTDGTGIKITEREQAESYPKNLDEPTTSRIARNETIEKTFIQERKDNRVKNVPTANSNSTWDEPETQYKTVYPYNDVLETESGHLLEFDDTPEAERIHLAHRNGSFQEWFPNGDKVEKITKNNYTIVMKDDSVYIMGNCNVTVQGSAQVYVKQDALLKVDGDVQVAVGGNYTETVSGTYTVTSGGNMKFVAPRIDLNP